MNSLALIVAVIFVLLLVGVWLIVLNSSGPGAPRESEIIEQPGEIAAGPARPTVNEGDALRPASEAAAKQDLLVASLGQLYGNIFTADDPEKRVDFLVEYLKVARRLRLSGHPDMKPPAFLTYDQARLKLVEVLNERFDELALGAPNKIQDFDRLGLWFDEIAELYEQFVLEEVDLDLRDIPEAWDDWLLKHYEAPLFEQFRVDPEAAVQDFADIQLAAVMAIEDRDEFNVKFIRALCLANREVRAEVGEPALFELTKLTYAFNKERKAALRTAY